MAYAVDIEGRDDDGPSLIGPFETKKLAQRWADDAVPGFRSEGMISWVIRPMAQPIITVDHKD